MMNLFKITALIGAVCCLFLPATAGGKRAQWITPTDFTLSGALSAQEIAEYWIHKHGGGFNLEDTELIKTVRSPLGTHLHYRERVSGLPVLNSSLVISVDDNLRVQAIYHHLSGKTRALAAKFQIEGKKAVAGASAALQPGWLTNTPKAEAGWLLQGNQLLPVYRVSLLLQGSHGSWDVLVDATDGKILKQENRTRYHLAGKAAPGFPKGPAPTQSETVGRLAKAGKVVEGRADVFDPDPRTALKRDDLQDESPEGWFAKAYQAKTLPGLTQVDDTIYLEGPYVRLTDFDAPHTAPSTSTTGVWQGKRGASSFLDTMAYYHIHQNQTYVQSLGFLDLQNGPIDVDTDGHLGNDFSSYDPDRNRLSFGRGCVDDAEDADILLHFYGQALLHDAVAEWGGGDTGAIAQGFGDYWAASYSYGTADGASFFPERVFHWDGHGDGAWCWDGRMLNRIDASYSSSISYSEDMLLEGGHYTAAELWATPLFQSMMELVALGYDRSEMDRIVLQSLHSLGYGATMVEAAGSVVAAAKALYPDGPHAELLLKWFTNLNIYGDISLVENEAAPFVFVAAGNNHYPDPGETATFRYPLTNKGSVPARSVTVTFIASALNAVITKSTAAYGDIMPGETAHNITDFAINIESDRLCGQDIFLFKNISWRDPEGNLLTQEDYAYMGVGAPRFPNKVRRLRQAIPDADEGGLTDSIQLFTPSLNTRNFGCSVTVTHGALADLSATLTAPDGTVFAMKSHETEPGKGILSTSIPPFAHMLQGEWVLHVVDRYEGDVGTVEGWQITESFGVYCDPPDVIDRRYIDHFLFTAQDEAWTSELAVLNKTRIRGYLELTAFNETGDVLDVQHRILEPDGMVFGTPRDWFPRAKGIATIRAACDIPIGIQSNHRDPAGKYAAGLMGAGEGASSLPVPHIAEDPNFWTRGRITNLSPMALDVDFFAAGRGYALTLLPFGSKGLDFRDYFDGEIPRGNGFGRFSNETNNFGALAGIELFGAEDTGSSAAGLNLTGIGHGRLLVPHIPADKASFWSGIMLVNPSEFAVEVTAYAHNESPEWDGTSRLAKAEFTLPAFGKRVDVFENFFPDLDVSEAGWLVFDAAGPINGYQLVGSNIANGDMAGLPASTTMAPFHQSALFAKAGEEWNGLAVVAPHRRGANRGDLNFLDENGFHLHYEEISGPRYAGKFVLQLPTFDRPVHIQADVFYSGITAFTLTGSYDGDRISALNTITSYETPIRIDTEDLEGTP